MILTIIRNQGRMPRKGSPPFFYFGGDFAPFNDRRGVTGEAMGKSLPGGFTLQYSEIHHKVG